MFCICPVTIKVFDCQSCCISFYLDIKEGLNTTILSLVVVVGYSYIKQCTNKSSCLGITVITVHMIKCMMLHFCSNVNRSSNNTLL